MRGDTNFKGSDSSDPTVYSLYCGIACKFDMGGGGVLSLKPIFLYYSLFERRRKALRLVCFDCFDCRAGFATGYKELNVMLYTCMSVLINKEIEIYTM